MNTRLNVVKLLSFMDSSYGGWKLLHPCMDDLEHV